MAIPVWQGIFRYADYPSPSAGVKQQRLAAPSARKQEDAVASRRVRITTRERHASYTISNFSRTTPPRMMWVPGDRE